MTRIEPACGEDVRQALVDLGRLAGAAANERDPALAQARLDRGPIHQPGFDLLLEPDLQEPRVGVLGAPSVRRFEQPLAATVAALPPLAAADPAGGL